MPTANRNEELHRLLQEATGKEADWTNDVRANCFGWLHLERPEKLKQAAKALAGKVRLCTVTAYAEERDDANKRRRIAYHFATGDTTLTVTVPLYDPDTLEKLPVPSITPWFLNADWNEREFREMFNIDIIGHPNPNRLFLDERLDAGIMTRLIPFSAMAHGAASNTLWERVLEAKGVSPEDRRPSLAVPAEPIKVEPKVTPVAATAPAADAAVPPTLASIAASAEVLLDSSPLDARPQADAAQEGDAAQADTAPVQAQSQAASAQAAEPAPEAPVSAPGPASEPVSEPASEAAPAQAAVPASDQVSDQVSEQASELAPEPASEPAPAEPRPEPAVSAPPVASAAPKAAVAGSAQKKQPAAQKKKAAKSSRKK